eukprot:879814_1
MGNKHSDNENKNTIHTCTSITTKKNPSHIFMSDDNTCIVVDTSITFYCYSPAKNRFVEQLRYETLSLIDGVIYNPFYDGLIYWNQLEYHQFKYKKDGKSNITYTVEHNSILTSQTENALSKKTTVQTNVKIIHGSLLRQDNLLLFVLNNAAIIIMQWNKSKQIYEYLTHFKMEQCDNIIGITFHEQRAKMALLAFFAHHYYLNIYYIGDMLRHIDNSTAQMKADPTYIHKPKLLLSRLVYQNPGFQSDIVSQFSELLQQRSGSGKVMKH